MGWWRFYSIKIIMIIDVLLILATVILDLFFIIASAIQFIVPVAIQNGLGYVFGGIGMFQGMFPVDQLILVFVFLFVLILVKYLVKWTIALLNLIPGVDIDMPRFFEHHTRR